MSENLHVVAECKHVIINSAAGGTLAVVAAVANQRVGIYKIVLVVATAITLTFQDTAGGALSAPYVFGANGGSITLDTQMNGDPWYQSGVGLGIQLLTSVAVQVSADIYFLQGP
jgi:hypothetical protein